MNRLVRTTLSKEEAASIFTRDISEALFRAVHDAQAAWKAKIDPEAFVVCSPTTRAAFINDYMIHYAEEYLSGNSSVSFVSRAGRRKHMIVGDNDKIELKFKKLGRNRRPSNVPTQAVLDFNSQVMLPFGTQLEMEGFEYPRANCVMGYVLNPLETEVEAVYVLCPYGSQNLWEWHVTFEREETQLPLASESIDTRPNKTVRVRPPQPELEGETNARRATTGESRDGDTG